MQYHVVDMCGSRGRRGVGVPPPPQSPAPGYIQSFTENRPHIIIDKIIPHTPTPGKMIRIRVLWKYFDFTTHNTMYMFCAL